MIIWRISNYAAFDPFAGADGGVHAVAYVEAETEEAAGDRLLAEFDRHQDMCMPRSRAQWRIEPADRPLLVVQE